MAKKSKFNLPLLIILCGIAFSLYLLSCIPDEIYFSGDAGLKALLAKQFSSGKLNFDLDLTVPSWVQNVWDNGLYPFQPPFSYKIANRYYITFPFTFPLITAPFYALLGFRGFYIVPLLSTWIIWLNFYRICQFFKVSVTATSVGLATLIFASPLTMYSAMYWEHTLAVSLAFGGLAIILTKGEQAFTVKNAVVSGILIGLSVWFRPEFFAIVATLVILVLASYKVKLGYLNIIYENQTAFLISLITSIFCFFIINQLIYNHPLGIHALQVVEDFSFKQRLLIAYELFGRLWKKLRENFPIIYFTIAFIGLSVFSNGMKLTAVMRKILLISIPFIFLVPIILPSDGGKQWGARFLLILIPLVSLLAVFIFDSTLSIRKFGIRYISSTVFVGLFLIAVNINTFVGINYCYLDASREALDVLNFLRKDNHKIVAVANQYISQSFESAFKDKIFFLTKKPDNVGKLSLALHEQGSQKFIYVCASYASCFSSPTLPDKLEIPHQQEILHVQFTEIHRNKKYFIKEGEITQKF
ncbi:hypothetical protein JYQ62_36940 [Nostoc sp. UHCC 0702]|nr:hypothetical protein JYQ62_36940 [Nostoc sp. UHCC 0702]